MHKYPHTSSCLFRKLPLFGRLIFPYLKMLLIFVIFPIIKIFYNNTSVALLIVHVVISRGPEFWYLFKFLMCVCHTLITLCHSTLFRPKFGNPFCRWCPFFMVDEWKSPLLLYEHGQTLRIPGGWGFQIARQSHVKVVRLSALNTGRPKPPGNIPSTHLY